MKRPIIDYWLRLAAKGNDKKEKILSDRIEYYRTMRAADREIERILLPIIEKLNNLIKKLSWNQ